MDDAVVQSTQHGQVQVHFVTSFADIELPEAKRQLLVPTSKSNPTIGIRHKLTDLQTYEDMGYLRFLTPNQCLILRRRFRLIS
jgi:hypothetical protein